jgi:hypothetical protein
MIQSRALALWPRFVSKNGGVDVSNGAVRQRHRNSPRVPEVRYAEPPRWWSFPPLWLRISRPVVRRLTSLAS